MWRSSSWVVYLRQSALGILSIALAASETLAQPSCPLLARAGHVPCAVVLGRFVACDAPSYASRSEATDNEAAGERETLCIQSADGNYVLRYERITANEQLAIDFIGAGELRIESRASGKHVQFVQPAKGRLTLAVEEGSQQQRGEAATLWHLLLAEPELCQRHLLPLLQIVTPDWKLAEQRDAIERLMLASDGEHDALSLQQIHSLVEDLGKPNFAVRQAAYRELVGRGPSILPQLARIKPNSLDAEQRARLADVRGNFAYASADTIERVSTWLSNDREAWQALAKRPEESVRTIANARLQQLP